jgi:hypothetical protein
LIKNIDSKLLFFYFLLDFLDLVDFLTGFLLDFLTGFLLDFLGAFFALPPACDLTGRLHAGHVSSHLQLPLSPLQSPHLHLQSDNLQSLHTSLDIYILLLYIFILVYYK